MASVLEGMHGKNLSHHFSIPQVRSLPVRPGVTPQIAMTWMSLPEGHPGPTPSFAPEEAFAVSVHTRRPDIKGEWGTWLDGKFFPVREWPLGGVGIYDLRANPINLRRSGFECVHIYLPRHILDAYTDDSDLPRVDTLLCELGTKDDVLLNWIRALLPCFSPDTVLPNLVMDHLVLMLCAHLTRRYSASRILKPVENGTLERWQQERAMALLHSDLRGETKFAELAGECGLSASRFARAFKTTFGMPPHRYLLQIRLDTAKSLMLSTDKPLPWIALEAGFSDQAAFTRTFSNVVGTSPGRWRRENRSAPRKLR